MRITTDPDDLPRVFRGGYWNEASVSYFPAKIRLGYDPSYRSVYRGFRCALRGREPVRENP